MRILSAAISIVILATTSAWADEVTDLRDQVLKAAAKDPADLQKFKTFSMKCKGISKLTPDPVEGTYEEMGVYPGKMKLSWETSAGGRAGVSLCVSDDRGWRKFIGYPAVDLGVDELNDIRNDVYAIWASSLLLLTEPDTKLSLAGRGKVGDDSVVGLKLTRRPFPEITLQFDEKSHLLRKMSYRSRENGVVISKDMIYGGHKLTGGLMLPTTQTTLIRGKESYIWTDLEFAFPDKHDGKMFDKP